MKPRSWLQLNLLFAWGEAVHGKTVKENLTMGMPSAPWLPHLPLSDVMCNETQLLSTKIPSTWSLTRLILLQAIRLQFSGYSSLALCSEMCGYPLTVAASPVLRQQIQQPLVHPSFFETIDSGVRICTGGQICRFWGQNLYWGANLLTSAQSDLVQGLQGIQPAAMPDINSHVVCLRVVSIQPNNRKCESPTRWPRPAPSVSRSLADISQVVSAWLLSSAARCPPAPQIMGPIIDHQLRAPCQKLKTHTVSFVARSQPNAFLDTRTQPHTMLRAASTVQHHAVDTCGATALIVQASAPKRPLVKNSSARSRGQWSRPATGTWVSKI